MDDHSSSATNAAASVISGYQPASTIGPQHVVHSKGTCPETYANDVECAPRTCTSFSTLPVNSIAAAQRPQAPPSQTVGEDTTNASSFSEFAHSSRTNLQSLMNSAPPKAIDWTALHAEQLQHYSRIKRRSSESIRSQMGLLYEEDQEDDDEAKPGQNATWGDGNCGQISQRNSGTYGLAQSGHMSLPSGSSSANAFFSILNSTPTNVGDNASSTEPNSATNSSSFGQGGLTLTRRSSANALSSSSSSLQLQQRPAVERQQSQPHLSRDRSDQWLDYRRRLEAATGVPMVTTQRGNAGGLGLARSSSKRGLVLSRSSSRSNLMLSKSTSTSRSSLLLSISTSRPSLLALAGRASQSNSARSLNSLGSQTSATSASTGIQSLTPNSTMYAAGAGGGTSPSSSMIRASSFCKKMSLKDTPLK